MPIAPRCDPNVRYVCLCFNEQNQLQHSVYVTELREKVFLTKRPTREDLTPSPGYFVLRHAATHQFGREMVVVVGAYFPAGHQVEEKHMERVDRMFGRAYGGGVPIEDQ